MAEKETVNEPKDLVEAVPEEIEKIMSMDERRALENANQESYNLEAWVPKTQIGLDVKNGKEKNIDSILDSRKKILEPQIVDKLLRIEYDLLLIGQAKGKFGGGKRRAWRQTQRKTMEGNIVTFSCMAVVGDKNGHIGIGMGKAKETLPSREKALRNAKLGVIKITRGFETPEGKDAAPH